jgi:hypothetical protein
MTPPGESRGRKEKEKARPESNISEINHLR